MEEFIHSCNRSDEYPKNLLSADTPQYSIHALDTQLDQRASRLFSDEARSAVDFLESMPNTRTPKHSRIKSLALLETHLQTCDPDPECRFICIHAPHSRDRLRISRRMFTYLLTYIRIPPPFLEYVFPFGRQHYVQDFHSSGFRNTSRMTEDEAVLKIPRLHISGRQIELSYSLKSVEMCPEDSDRPWSIRQCSIYHAFDLEFERTTWLTVKGNELVQDLAHSFFDRKARQRPSSPTQSWQALNDTMDVHEIFSNWSAENWHWYINFLENALQESTRRTLSISIDQKQPLPAKLPDHDGFDVKGKTSSKAHLMLPENVKRGIHKLQNLSGKLAGLPKDSAGMQWEEREKTPPPPDAPEIEDQKFAFGDLQDVQAVEEKAAEASLVLKANANVLAQIRQTYWSLADSDDLADLDRKSWKPAVKAFVKRVDGTISDLAMQQSRADTLLRLLGERKNLLYGILQYENMVANRVSSMKMESMTEEMHAIAHKTKAETVSMRIITLVTLFFLPGTFISTLMSTPIVSFAPESSGFSAKNIGVGALQFYVVVSLPLVLLTFLAWYGVYWWESRQEKKKSTLRHKPRSMV